MVKPPLFVAVLACCLLLLGCQKEEIKDYRIAKEKAPKQAEAALPAGHPQVDSKLPANHPPTGDLPPGHPPTGGMPPGHPPVGDSKGAPAQSAMSAMASMPVPTASADNTLVWTAPASWQTKPLGQMRRGSFGIKGADGSEADLSIFVFSGPAGGVIDNINRWRGQIGLAPVDQAKLADETSLIKTESGLDLTVVDMTNATGERIIGAILSENGFSWFFKLKGPAALLGAEKNSYLSFLKTVKKP